MMRYFDTPVRALLVALAVAFAAQLADARSDPTASRSTARSAGDAVPTPPGGVPLDGVLIIVGIVAVLVTPLVWKF